MSERRGFVLWPTGRQEWLGVAGNVINILGPVLLVLGIGLSRTLVREGHPLPYVVAFVWVGYVLVKAVRTHSRVAIILALSTIALGLVSLVVVGHLADKAELAKRQAADAESLHRSLLQMQREDHEDCLSKTPAERRSAEVRRLVLEFGRPVSVIERHFEEYASQDWNCGIPATPP